MQPRQDCNSPAVRGNPANFQRTGTHPPGENTRGTPEYSTGTDRAEEGANYLTPMKSTKFEQLDANTSGKIGWALLWLLGVPLPVLLVIYLLKGG